MSRRGFLLLGLLLCGVGLYGCQKPKEPTALETTVASDSETARREIEIETPTETSEAETAEMDSREAKEIDVEAIVNRSIPLSGRIAPQGWFFAWTPMRR